MVVSLEEVKAHLRIEDEDEDTYIESLILQAQAAAEDFCRVRFEEDDTFEDVPEPVRLAILLMVSHYYENREVSDRQIYFSMRIAFENLLYPYRDPAKMF